MTKPKTYSEVRKQTAAAVDSGLRCRNCKHVAPWDDLSTYGALCKGCYTAWLAQPLPPPGRDPNAVTRALPRRSGYVQAQSVGDLLAKRPSREQVKGYADELGIDVNEG